MSVPPCHEHIKVKPFASVLALDNPPAIHHAALPSSSNASSCEADINVHLDEGCLVTKTVKYTHRLVHWVNANRESEDDCDAVESIVEDILRIAPRITGFELDHPGNCVFLEPSLHTALEVYAFVAVTASLSTLESLTNMVQRDNDRRLEAIDRGVLRCRALDFSHPSFTDPQYEIVAIHPEHFLPRGTDDRCLRQTTDPRSPRLPPFHHRTDRSPLRHLNVFLVVLNAEIKFRRYFEMIQKVPPTTPLPADVIHLMRLTLKLVELLYWVGPGDAEGFEDRTMESEGSEGGIGNNQHMEMSARLRKAIDGRRWTRWFDSLDQETRMAYGRALISGHGDTKYDPALFEDAIPINDSPHLYSEKANMEAWQQGVSSDPSENPL